MKKVIFFSIALLAFVSCTKDKLSPSELADLEVVFEELETGTKAEVSEVNLNVYGDFAPKSQTLTAKLRYKASGNAVSGEISYKWNVNCAAVGEAIDPNFQERNTLTATKAGTGTVSVTATYKGQDVQSKDVDVKVTALEYLGLSMDFVGYSLAYTPLPEDFNCYPIPGRLEELMGASYDTHNFSYKLSLDYKDNGVLKHQNLTDDPEASVTIADFPSASFTSNMGRIYVELGENKSYSSNFLGTHTIKAEYKSFSEELEFNIISDIIDQDFYIKTNNGTEIRANGSASGARPSTFTVEGGFDKTKLGGSGNAFMYLANPGVVTVALEKGSSRQVLTPTIDAANKRTTYTWPSSMTGSVTIKIYYFNKVIFTGTLNAS